MSIIYNQLRFNLKALYAEHPQFESVIGSEGRDKRFRNNIFEKIPLFTVEKTNDDDIPVIGVVNGRREWLFLSYRVSSVGLSSGRPPAVRRLAQVDGLAARLDAARRFALFILYHINTRRAEVKRGEKFSKKFFHRYYFLRIRAGKYYRTQGESSRD